MFGLVYVGNCWASTIHACNAFAKRSALLSAASECLRILKISHFTLTMRCCWQQAVPCPSYRCALYLLLPFTG